MVRENGRMRRTVAITSALVAVLVGCDSDDTGTADTARVVQPGAPGDTTRELSQGDLDNIDTPAHTDADTAFMQRMIVHHAQALTMTSMVDSRTDSEDLPLLAQRISASQQAEIALIEQWLTDRGEPVATADHAHEMMPGMASPEQLAELEDARGEEFDALFLDLMIAHHQGALTMVADLYAAGGGLEPAVDHFARGVEADQSIEIERMKDMRQARAA